MNTNLFVSFFQRKTDVEPFLISLEKHQPNANCDDICRGVKAQLAKISRGCADQFESFRKEELLRFDPDAKIFSITRKLYAPCNLSFYQRQMR